MDIDKNKSPVPRLDENPKDNYDTDGSEVPLTITETIAKNKESIDKSLEFLKKQ
ncbi:hypothetical protein [Ureibacillus sinduriensis]|uniref:hypothetical protein n=1 Tax=Ureibacillus sinduriensis TaxID=561440 RepID=UPI000B087EAE|nr:hypothetical protein [Ureibacillus sinduriensis]